MLEDFSRFNQMKFSLTEELSFDQYESQVRAAILAFVADYENFAPFFLFFNIQSIISKYYFTLKID